jgi:3-hydroxyacyl-CoA dehydrogenase
MSELIRYEVKDRVAVLTIDNPPVNALSPAVWEGIDAAVARAGADPAADAIVLIGAGSTFIAGADIKVFDTLKTAADSLARSGGTHALLKRLEDSPKPLVAAIHGNALGGGLEVAQACHFRVAVKSAKVGQPEVLLGIIPGAGGTQRLPRLCGAELALAMCTDGKPVAAAKAQAAGIIDAVVGDDLLAGAIEFANAKAAAGTTRKTREIALSAEQISGGLAACEATRTSLAKTARGAKAPYAAVDAIEAGLRLPFDEGSTREREIFARCVVSTESKALRHLFFAEREVAKVPDIPKETPTREIRRAAVVGAGTMGGGIAMNYANAGIPVLLKEVDQAALDRGLATIRKNYEVTMSKGKMTPEQYEKNDGAHHAAGDLRRLRPGGHRHRGGVREHGSEEEDVRRAREGRRGRTASSRRTRRRSTSISSRRPADGRRRCSAITISARRT